MWRGRGQAGWRRTASWIAADCSDSPRTRRADNRFGCWSSRILFRRGDPSQARPMPGEHARDCRGDRPVNAEIRAGLVLLWVEKNGRPDDLAPASAAANTVGRKEARSLGDRAPTLEAQGTNPAHSTWGIREGAPARSGSLLQMADLAANTAANQRATFGATLRLAGLHQLRARAERHDYSAVNRTGTCTPADPFLRGMWQHSSPCQSSQVATDCSSPHFDKARFSALRPLRRASKGFPTSFHASAFPMVGSVARFRPRPSPQRCLPSESGSSPLTCSCVSTPAFRGLPGVPTASILRVLQRAGVGRRSRFSSQFPAFGLS